MSLQDDRRGAAPQRVPFEALVVVANQQSGAGAYECEAVDLSEHGMHLRTAYLPDLGQPLTFRFDGGTGEVVAEGTVLWRDEQAKGGEFGVRFTKMAPACLAALREICGIAEDGSIEEKAADAPGKPADAAKGSRVRLHIDGLGSPMRARVRDTGSGEVMVGSNLEFLKVGRVIDFEDVEGARKRPATIDKVEVEIDPETRVPQLVVTLRYEGAEGVSRETKISAAALTGKASAEVGADDADHEEQDSGPSAFASFATKARGVAAQVGPKLSAAGSTMGAAFSSLAAKVKARRAGGDEEEEAAKPRRTTSPAPDGGIRASGRHVTRGDRGESRGKEDLMEDEGTELEEADDAQANKRRLKLIGISAAGFLVVLLAVFGLRARGAPPGADQLETAAADTKQAAPLALPAAPPSSGDAITANVPLFGATPLSTTEPAQLPAPDSKPAAAAVDDKADDKDDKDDKPASTTYGKGKVVKAKTVRLKMDAPITEIKGSVEKNVLTLTLPGRRNVEGASTFTKKDKRIAAVKAVPRDGGVDLVLTFKDSPPPFFAKANGKMLEVDFGETPKPGADDGVAEGKKGKKKHKAIAKKKDGKGKKKHKKSDD